MKTVISRPRASGGGFMLIRGGCGGEEAAVSAVYVNEAKDIPVMTAVLPPPDLRDRDGWHILIDDLGDDCPMAWSPSVRLWGETRSPDGSLGLTSTPEYFAEYNCRYRGPLFPVPDDDAAVERVETAIRAAWNEPIPQSEIGLLKHSAARRAARAAIAAIRKESDNG